MKPGRNSLLQREVIGEKCQLSVARCKRRCKDPHLPMIRVGFLGLATHNLPELTASVPFP